MPENQPSTHSSVGYVPQGETANTSDNIVKLKLPAKAVVKKKPCKHIKVAILHNDSYCTVTRCLKCRKLSIVEKENWQGKLRSAFDKNFMQKHITEVLAKVAPKKTRKKKVAPVPATTENNR